MKDNGLKSLSVMPRLTKTVRFTWLLSSLFVSYIQSCKFRDSSRIRMWQIVTYFALLYTDHHGYCIAILKLSRAFQLQWVSWSSPVPKEVCIYCLSHKTKRLAYCF